jgi:hypothetical protein
LIPKEEEKKYSEEFEAYYARFKCMICGEEDGTYRLQFHDWVTKYSHGPIHWLGEWYFCKEYGERFRPLLQELITTLLLEEKEDNIKNDTTPSDRS